MNNIINKKTFRTRCIIPFLLLSLLIILVSVNNKMNKSFVIREEFLTYEKLPSNFNNYKILQLSDLHSKEFGENNSDLISAIKKIHPDVILVTGDMFTVTDISIDMNEEDLVPYQLLSTLATDYKIIYIPGNHEEGKDIIYNGEDYRYRNRNKNNAYNRYVKKLQDLGVVFVENQEYDLYKNNDFIKIYGVYNESMEKNEYYQSINLNKDLFNIILCHDPKYFPTFANMGFDLMLSGHVHGGVIRLPLIGGLLSPDRTLFPKYDKCIYQIGNSYMNVSSGLGDSIIPRIFNPPEINVITLKN